MDLMAEIFDGQRNQRHGQEENQSQLTADSKHDREDDQQSEESLLAVHDRRTGYLSHGAEIVCRPGHEVSGAVILKEFQRKFLQMCVKILAQVILDVA